MRPRLTRSAMWAVLLNKQDSAGMFQKMLRTFSVTVLVQEFAPPWASVRLRVTSVDVLYVKPGCASRYEGRPG